MNRRTALAGFLPGFLLLALGLLLPGCGNNSSARPVATAQPVRTPEHSPAPNKVADEDLIPVTLQLNWFPEAEHGGYYAALVHGYYRDAGLDVKILPGEPNSPVVQQVARGMVDFGVVNADNIIFGRAQQAPIVAVMAPLQISP